MNIPYLLFWISMIRFRRSRGSTSQIDSRDELVKNYGVRLTSPNRDRAGRQPRIGCYGNTERFVPSGQKTFAAVLRTTTIIRNPARARHQPIPLRFSTENRRTCWRISLTPKTCWCPAWCARVAPCLIYVAVIGMTIVIRRVSARTSCTQNPPHGTKPGKRATRKAVTSSLSTASPRRK